MQLRLGISDRAAQLSRNLAVRFPLHIVQQEDRSIAGRKSAQRSVQRDPVHRASQTQIVNRARIQDCAFCRVLQASCCIQRHRFRVTRAQPHQHHIYRQTIEPGGERRVATKRRQLLKALQECLLRAIFCFCALSRDAQANSVHPAFMCLIQTGKSFSISHLRLLHKFHLRGCDCLRRVHAPMKTC